jgi:ATP-dependent DNA helicase RecQ
MNAQETLKQFFGYQDFRPGQKEIISSIMNGKNVLAILPTSGGKSICYQIPALISPSFSIVISPLIALMKDQVDSINKRENVAAYINSSLDYRESENILQNIAHGIIKLLYLSPEKVDNRQFAERIKSLKPSYIFVDEAHCISEWGHNFRPSYRKIKQFIEFTEIENVSAFTATATKDIRLDIVEQLGMSNSEIFVRGFERDNLHLNVINTKQKKETLVKLLTKKSLPAIIYTATRKLTEEVVEFLRINKLDAAYYHAGLAPELRKIIQDDFLNDRLKIVVSTNAFGMGIDKSDIRTVVHFNVPGNIENYYQEIGRAGRDGIDSNIYLLYEEKDRLIQEYFIRNSHPSKEQIQRTYNAVCDYGNVALGFTQSNIPIDKNLLTFLAGKDINKSLADASIRILEESEYLTASSEFNKKHFARILIEPNKLNEYVKNISDNELKDLILILVKEYGGSIFRVKTLINVTRISELLNADTHEVEYGLNTLNQAGIILYEEPSRFPTVSLPSPRVRIEELKLNYTKINSLYKHNIDKLEQMIGYAAEENCRFKFILKYFGEDDNNYRCGKCDNCTGQKSSGDNYEYIANHIIASLEERGEQITDKDLINILLGKSKIQSHQTLSTFGSCKHFGKNEIESVIDKMTTSQKLILEKGQIKLTSEAFEELIATEPINETNSNYENGLKLFNLLKQIRKEAASRFNQPYHMVCPDDVLREIAHKRPKSLAEMMEINGFNKRMFNKIGEDFLSSINESGSKEQLDKKLSEKHIPKNILQILELVQKKYSLSEISSLTKLSESILSIQIETLLGTKPELEIDHLYEKEELNKIRIKIDEGISDLKTLRQELDNKISYAKLRIALAKRKFI